jgi:hypothetical protein
MDNWKILSEKTLVPVSAISLIIAASMWLTSIWRQGEANAAQISDVKAIQLRENDKIYRELEKINDKLDRMMEREDYGQ